MSQNKMERFGPLFLVSGVGFFCISLFGMGLSAYFMIKDKPMDPVIAAALASKDPEDKKRLESEHRGRREFMSQGCLHCHSQFVRPIGNEAMRYGPPSKDTEYLHEIPHLFGTRRVGPDLAREGLKRTDDWHYAHLYNPRITVPDSNMPGYPWLFEKKGKEILPKQGAQDLVAYMQSLGRAKRDKIKQATDDHYAGLTIKDVGIPKDPEMKDILRRRGAFVFARECSGCHGVKGDGMGQAQPFLLPVAQDLTTSQWNAGYIIQTMATGMPNTAMPSFRDMGYDDMRAVATYVTSKEFYAPEGGWPTGFTPERLMDQGKTIYDAQCAFCHGTTGNGDGPAGLGLRPRPAKFTHQRPNIDKLVASLENGVPGTAMPAFKQLGLEEKYAVGAYVQSLYTTELLQKATDTP